MKKIVSIISIIVLLTGSALSLTSCAKKDAAAEATATAAVNPTPTAQLEFRIGLECAYPPFNWTQNTNANGAVQISGSQDYASGYDIEIAKKIAAGLGRKLVIVKTEWDGLPPALTSGTIDAIIAGMSPTAERKQTIDFTDNYYRSELVLVVKKGSKYENATSIADFSGAKVTAQLNTFHYSVIDQIPGVQKQPAMSDFGAMRVSLQSGIIDAYVSERPEGVSANAANPNYVMVQFAAGKGFTYSDDDAAVAVGIKKGQPELVAQINTILSGISETDRQQIMDTAIQNQPATQ